MPITPRKGVSKSNKSKSKSGGMGVRRTSAPERLPGHRSSDPTLGDLLKTVAGDNGKVVPKPVLKGKEALRYIIGVDERGVGKKSGNPPAKFDEQSWLQSLIDELMGPEQQLDQGAYLAPFDTAQSNLTGAYNAAKAAINTQPASLRTAFAQMDQSAMANQQAIQQQVAQRLAQTQQLAGTQVGATQADLAAQGVSAAPVEQQAQLQAQALAAQNVNQAAAAGNQAAAQQAAGDRRESDTGTLIGSALGQLEANRVGASGRIEGSRAAAMQRFSEMQMAREDAARQRKLDVLNRVQELQNYTSPSEIVRQQIKNSPSNPLLLAAGSIIADIDKGEDDLDTVLAGLQDKKQKEKMRKAGIDPNRLASVLRAAYNDSAEKRELTLDEVRSGGGG